jgi:dihydrolipoamide dehydrogenase
MESFDVIVVGSGSGNLLVEGFIRRGMKVALIEKDELGGLCLNRGCIPSKMVIYPADIVNTIKQAKTLGIHAEITEIDFEEIMERMRESIRKSRLPMEQSINRIRNLTFYDDIGVFVDDYTLQVKGDLIKGEKIFLVSGTRPSIPPVKGLEKVDYLTNRNVWDLTKKPASLIIVGGGFIAVEMGHFFSSMGTKVQIISRSPRLIKETEPEISQTLLTSMKKRMNVSTGTEVQEVEEINGKIRVIAKNRGGETSIYESEKILLATGRKGNADILKVEKTGVKADSRGFIKVNEHYETTKPGIWAFGDAIGKAMFKHVANKEAQLVWQALTHENKEKMDYEKVPYAVYGWPQLASVGLTQEEAEKKGYDILVGVYNYGDTAKGDAMGEEDGFLKVIVEEKSLRILGAHIIGPYAPILIQEIINAMYTDKGDIYPIYDALYIHPALPEVVQRAFYNLRKPEHNHH